MDAILGQHFIWGPINFIEGFFRKIINILGHLFRSIHRAKIGDAAAYLSRLRFCILIWKYIIDDAVLLSATV